MRLIIYVWVASEKVNFEEGELQATKKHLFKWVNENNHLQNNQKVGLVVISDDYGDCHPLSPLGIHCVVFVV
ncbi:hypothetical protein ACODQQ_19455, partial [Enterobacter quasiroggenkampii]